MEAQVKRDNAIMERLINELDVAELTWEATTQAAWDTKTPEESLEAAQKKAIAQKEYHQAQAALTGQLRLFWKAGYRLCRQ